MRLPFGYSEISEADVALLDPSPAERVRFRIESNDQVWLSDIDRILESEGFTLIDRRVVGNETTDSTLADWRNGDDEQIEVLYNLDTGSVTVLFNGADPLCV